MIREMEEEETHYTPISFDVVFEGDCCTNTNHIVL